MLRLIGSRFLAHETAAGRVFLAYLPEDELPLGVDEVRSQLTAIRAKGYEMRTAHHAPAAGSGTSGLAAPVFDQSRRVVGVLGLTLPSHIEGDALLGAAGQRAANRCRECVGRPRWPCVAERIGPEHEVRESTGHVIPAVSRSIASTRVTSKYSRHAAILSPRNSMTPMMGSRMVPAGRGTTSSRSIRTTSPSATM